MDLKIAARALRHAPQCLYLEPSHREWALVHIASGHMAGGSRLSELSTLFPEGMNAKQVESAVRQAYRFGSEKLATQGDRVLLRSRAAGMTIEMWVNRVEKMIETAYPVWK